MYVCICNALTERHVEEAVRETKGSVTSVYDCFGVSPRCGKCAVQLRDLLRKAASVPIPAE